jgi:ribosomal-protein-alanine N-acetyltransferase
MNKRIETKRLILRSPKASDAEPMFSNWANDPEVTKYLTWNPHESVEVTKMIVSRWLQEEEDPKTVRFLITVKGNDDPVGSIDVVGYHDGDPEIGYCLSRKLWGQGYMTEACQAVMAYLFALGHKRILIDAAEDNIGSNRVIAKCGFRFVGKERKEHTSDFKEAPVTLNHYEILRPDADGKR